MTCAGFLVVEDKDLPKNNQRSCDIVNDIVTAVDAIKFRNKLGRYDRASDIVSGLVNFRIIMQTNRTLL